MSFEHAMKRFLHLDLQIFRLLLTGCSIFSTVQKFCPVQVTRSSSFLSSYELLNYIVCIHEYIRIYLCLFFCLVCGQRFRICPILFCTNPSGLSQVFTHILYAFDTCILHVYNNNLIVSSTENRLRI